MCVGETEDKSKVCPITKIEFKSFSSKDKAKEWVAADKFDWDFEDYEDDIYMLWTKDADSLPIV